jgi:hypothetical protein
MINTQLFTQIGLDSGALSQLGSVVHQVSEPGDYRGVVLRGDDQVADFSFVVAKEGRSQLDLDVAALDAGGQDDDCGCGPTSHDTTPLAVGGYLLVHVGSGRGRYAVVVSIVDASGKESRQVFDSRELGAGDIFAATVLRPGRYGVTNAADGSTARLEVPYPEPGREPLRLGDPVTIKVGRGGFSPDEVKVKPGQGQTYAVETGARVVIELVEPYDRKPTDRPRYRWSRRPIERGAPD